jgi:hypothetical protein
MMSNIILEWRYLILKVKSVTSMPIWKVKPEGKEQMIKEPLTSQSGQSFLVFLQVINSVYYNFH